MSPTPSPAAYERNLRLYPWLLAFVFTPLFLPIVVLFWQDNGLDMRQVYVLQGLFAISMVVLEVPTGMVADRIGKTTSLRLGIVVIFIGLIVYGLGHSFAVFLVAEILWALGAALLSGADSSLLYDSLEALGRTREYTAREGRARAIQMASFAASNLVGGFVGAWSYRAAIWGSLIGPIVALVIVWSMVEVRPADPTSTVRQAWREYRSLLGQTLRFVRRHDLVRWQIVFLSILSAGQTWLLWMYQPYMEHVGLPVWAFGVAFAGFNLFAAGVSSRVASIERWAGPRGTLVLIAALEIVPPLLMAFVSVPAGVLLILGHQAARALARPILSERILRYTFADKRSTVLSVASLGGRLFFAASAPFIGEVARGATVSGALGAQAFALAVLLLAIGAGYRRIHPKYFVVKDTVLAEQGPRPAP